MNNFSKSPWSRSLKVMTISAIVVIIAGIVIAAIQFMNATIQTVRITDLVLIVILGLCLLASVCLAPRGVSSSDKGITVHLMCGRIFIPKNDIVKIEPYSDDKGTMRICGIGGVFGYVGLYRNGQFGKFSCFATDFSRSFVIYRQAKRPFVVTVEDKAVLEL